jgi:hypothetical protein
MVKKCFPQGEDQGRMTDDRQEFAETLALRALGWLAASDELFPVFLGATGAAVGELQERASDQDFLGAVLDFLLMDDAWVTSFCDAEGIAYADPQRARQLLPGGAEPHWT